MQDHYIESIPSDYLPELFHIEPSNTETYKPLMERLQELIPNNCAKKQSTKKQSMKKQSTKKQSMKKQSTKKQSTKKQSMKKQSTKKKKQSTKKQ